MLWIGVPAVFVLAFWFYVNAGISRVAVYEWGDWASTGMDAFRARHFNQYLGTYSSRLLFRHPGPLQAYLSAASESLLCGLFHFQSPHAAHVFGTAFYTLCFNFASFYVLFRLLNHKQLLIPAYIWIFCLQNTILQNQLSVLAQHNMSIPALTLLCLTTAALVSGRIWCLPLFALAATTCGLLHTFNATHVVVLTAIALSGLIYRKLRLGEGLFTRQNRRYLLLAAGIVAVGAFPVMYDQFFLTHNLSKILSFIRSNKLLEASGGASSHLGLVLRYIPAFFVSMFWGQEASMKLAVDRQFAVSVQGAVVFWSLFCTFTAVALIKVHDILIRTLTVLVVIGMFLVAQFSIANGTFDMEVYGRNLYGYVAVLGLVILLIADRYAGEFAAGRPRTSVPRNHTRRTAGWVLIVSTLALSIFPMVAFPDSKHFFNTPRSFGYAQRQLERGYFDVQAWLSTDPRVGEITDAVIRNGGPQNASIALFLDKTGDWTEVFSVLLQLVRQHRTVCVVDKQNSGLVGVIMGNEFVCTEPSDVDIYVADKPIPDGKQIYANGYYVAVMSRP